MCIKNDTIAVILDPTVAPTSWTGNSTTKNWIATFPWGQVSGVSACLTADYGTKSIITDKGVVVQGGENNGRYCYCKMTHPAVSKWVMVQLFDYQNNCNNLCYSATCARFGYNGSNINYRRAIFGSIW